jgi:hypothetical protein
MQLEVKGRCDINALLSDLKIYIINKNDFSIFYEHIPHGKKRANDEKQNE